MAMTTLWIATAAVAAGAATAALAANSGGSDIKVLTQSEVRTRLAAAPAAVPAAKPAKPKPGKDYTLRVGDMEHAWIRKSGPDGPYMYGTRVTKMAATATVRCDGIAVTQVGPLALEPGWSWDNKVTPGTIDGFDRNDRFVPNLKTLKVALTHGAWTQHATFFCGDVFPKGHGGGKSGRPHAFVG